MDNSNRQMGRNPESLGVNKMGKNIKKSPIHQPNFSNTNAAGARPQSQPQVYNINKNDFRSIVQQLTGSPLRESAPRPPNPPKPQSTRLQKIKPPPLTPINRPQLPVYPPPQMPPPPQHPPMNVPYNNSFARPPPPHPHPHPHPQYGQPPSPVLPPFTPTDIWANTAESPISAYMRYLQTSIVDSGPRQPGPGPMHSQGYPSGPPPSGLLPNPHVPPPIPSPRYGHPSPRMNGGPPFPSPRMNGPPSPLPSPGINGPPFLPSPTSQFLLPSPSPSGFWNMLSPHSSYPLLSPGMQQPPPMSPNFSFSPMGQPGILGPGPHPPPSPGYGFPLSPSGFFPITSPRWRA